jgi:hypothetical protein
VEAVKGMAEHLSILCSVVAHPYDATLDAIIELGPNQSMEVLGDAGGQVVAAYVAAKVGNFARLGREIEIGNNCRIAPFGDRTGHPVGRFPHYHRRILGPGGNTPPGGSIKWHRPWEKGW